MKTLPLLATMLLAGASTGAATIVTITNSDFATITGGTPTATANNPTGWTTVETSDSVYAGAPTGTNPYGNVLHFKDGRDSATNSYVQQDLSIANAGLTTTTSGIYAVSFDIGWRTDTSTFDNGTFLISLINSSDGSTLASQVFNLTSVTASGYPGLSTGTPGTTFNQTFNLIYDNTAVAAGNVVFRIARTDTFDSGGTGANSTAWVDNVAITTAVPEPSAGAMAALGAGLLLRRRRRSV